MAKQNTKENFNQQMTSLDTQLEMPKKAYKN